MRLCAFVALFVSTALCGFSAAPVIGVATALGTYVVDSSNVSGITDVSQGTRLETTAAPSDVKLQSGADVRLATRSCGTLYADHLLLESGAVRVGGGKGYAVDARRLQVQSDDPNAEAIVRLTNKTVEVASVGGEVNVMENGSLLARVASGTKVAFQEPATPPQDQNAQPAQTAAAPGKKSLPSDQKTLLWIIVITAGAALAIGLTAASQGKSL